VELEPGDRRRREPAGGRYRHHEAQRLPEWIALEHAHESRNQNEDRDDGGERKLEAGIEQRVRIPAEQNDRADEQEVPTVCGAGREPGQRAERTGHAGADDRGLSADREHVGADRSKRGELTHEPRYAQKPGENQRPARDVRNVLSGDGKQVVKARRPESLPEPVRQAGVLAEEHAFEHGCTLTVQSARDGTLEVLSQRVRDATESATVSDDAERMSAQHDMDAMATQPAALVEPVLRPTGLAQLSDRVDDGALWRRPPTRELEQHGLTDADLAEPKNQPGSTDVIAALLSRACDDETR